MRWQHGCTAVHSNGFADFSVALGQFIQGWSKRRAPRGRSRPCSRDQQQARAQGLTANLVRLTAGLIRPPTSSAAPSTAGARVDWQAGAPAFSVDAPAVDLVNSHLVIPIWAAAHDTVSAFDPDKDLSIIPLVRSVVSSLASPSAKGLCQPSNPPRDRRTAPGVLLDATQRAGVR